MFEIQNARSNRLDGINFVEDGGRVILLHEDIAQEVVLEPTNQEDKNNLGRLLEALETAQGILSNGDLGNERGVSYTELMSKEGSLYQFHMCLFSPGVHLISQLNSSGLETYTSSVDLNIYGRGGARLITEALLTKSGGGT
ncbi:MAG: hypothetical protein ABH849_00690 [Nanoarchaeota archaeon]